MPETNYNISGTLRLKGGQEFQRDLKSRLGAVKSEFAAFSSILATTGAVMFARNLMTAAATQEKALTSIKAGLKSTQYAAGLTNSELQNMASGLQKVGVIGDEVVMAGQGMLLTFTNIGRNVFPEATEVMADMALKMADMNYENVNMKDTAIQLGKALNDPIAGLNSLARVGVKFTDQQKDMIKALVEAGDIEGAQKIIIRELKTEFGGLNRELAQTEPGKVQKLANSVADLKEKGGALIYEFLNPVTRILSPVAEAFNNAAPPVQNFVKIVATAGVQLEPLAQLAEKFFGEINQGANQGKKDLQAFNAEVEKMDWTAATNMQKQLQASLGAAPEIGPMTPKENTLREKLSAVEKHVAKLKELGLEVVENNNNAVHEMTDEEKAVLQNKMQFQYDTQKISRASYLAYLRQREKDFDEYSSEWIGVQKDISKLQEEIDAENLNKSKTAQSMDIEQRKTWLDDTLGIITHAKNEFEETFNKWWSSQRQKANEILWYIGDSAALLGQAFVEGLKGEVDSWKKFLKSMLIVTLDMLEQYMVLAKLKTILDGVINPLAALRDSWKLVMAFAAFEAAKAGVAAFEFGGIVTQPTLALVGEAGQPEIIAPQRDFMSYSRQLINEALAGAGTRNVRGGDVNLVQNFNSPLTDRRQARKLTNNVLVPEMRRENKRSQRFLNKSVA